jgi:dolichol-phosphate mannosyltransferase
MASLLLVISGLFALLFLFLAVISEYIGRILVESKNRPLYYIREEYEKSPD